LSAVQIVGWTQQFNPSFSGGTDVC